MHDKKSKGSKKFRKCPKALDKKREAFRKELRERRRRKKRQGM